MTNKVTKYQAIQIWGEQMGSFQYYIDNQIALAQKLNAPFDAIYKHNDDTYATISDIKDKERQAQIYKHIAERALKG